MSSRKAIIVGSGAGGSVTAMTLAEAGWHVVVFEKGSNYFSDVGPTPGVEIPHPDKHTAGKLNTVFSNDEVKSLRYFEQPDPLAYPRTFRASADKEAKNVGSVNDLPVTVGGGTVHYGGASPRFWDIDFKGRSMLGPQPGADMADWPFEYAEIAPYYDDIEKLVGVQGDVDQIPQHPVLAHAPRSKPLPMPAGPQMRSAQLIAHGARQLGLHPYSYPKALNSRPYDGRPACNNCGFCSGYGCPIGARVGALGPLRRALKTGQVELRPERMVAKVNRKGRKATGVSYFDQHGKLRHEKADVVILAASAIESSRLALLSELPDPQHRIGKRLMFHFFTKGFAIFTDQRVHTYKGHTVTGCLPDFNDPDFPGARAYAKDHGLPYLRGGLCELGGSQGVIAEANFYQTILGVLSSDQPFGSPFKQLMRASIIRDRLAGVQLLGSDLPYLSNNVTLDEKVKDFNGVPVPRITYSTSKHEKVASDFYIPHISKMCSAAGAHTAAAIPSNFGAIGALSNIPDTKHVMGGMQMGDDPRASVVDGEGRMHHMDNVYVVDGGMFATSGGANPTNTLMAVALRSARKLAGTGKGSSAAGAGPAADERTGGADRSPLPLVGGGPR